MSVKSVFAKDYAIILSFFAQNYLLIASIDAETGVLWYDRFPSCPAKAPYSSRDEQSNFFL